MPQATALVSTHPRPEVAAGELLGAALEQVGDLASFVLVAPAGEHRSRLGELVAAADDLLAPDVVVGVSTSRIQAGADRWRGGEGGALGLLAAVGHAVGVHRLQFPDGDGVVGLPSLDGRDLVVLGDAASASVGPVVDQVAAGAPETTVVCGLLSAGPMEGAELWTSQGRHERGALALTIPRPGLEAVAVQGLRRLGATRTVTEVDGPIVFTLDGEPAMDVLRRDLAALEQRPRSADALVLALDRSTSARSPQPRRLDAALGNLLDDGASLVGSPILGSEPRRHGLALGGDAAGGVSRLEWLRVGARVCFAEDSPARVGVELARHAPTGSFGLALGDGDGLDALPTIADRFGGVLGLGAPVVLGPSPGGGGDPGRANGAARLAVAGFAADPPEASG